MTEYLIIIDSEQFLVEAPHRLMAWEVALAKAALMHHHDELADDNVTIEVLSMKEARKEGLGLFAERLDRLEVLEEFERLRFEEAHRTGQPVEVIS
ncbi:hypothetical protein [Thermococcus sp.]|uniref:hypothetical protein n=1 Tax=Thermococcus sp. TaxID=35749 RepID=UPI0026080B11|nr:hypothetical protein [Thermococcus sp.]